MIHPDQTGFIPGRFSFFNVRRLMNILYSKQDSASNVAILSLDAEKAFDQVEWSYIIAVLQAFDLGESFSCWVKMLYAKPRASVLTNFDKSSQFALHRGTRQGCPLSPLLFAIAIEPLATAIRNNPLIFSPKIGQLDHHISLYADDVILYLLDPERSIPPLLDLLKTFGKFSGYSVNWQKSELMLVTNKTDPSFIQNLPFKIAADSLKYLGVTIPKNAKDIYKLNYLVMLESLKLNIESWRTFPLSMVGRVNAIKMVILPRFLYLFQNLPIFLPKFFKLWIQSCYHLCGALKRTVSLNYMYVNQGRRVD